LDQPLSQSLTQEQRSDNDALLFNPFGLSIVLDTKYELFDIKQLPWYHVDMYKHVNPDNKCNRIDIEFLELLNALSDATRQEILRVISCQKEICVNDIAANFDLSRPTISHHLNLMRRVKLLNSRKEGKEIYYSFNKAYVIKTLESFLGELKNCC